MADRMSERDEVTLRFLAVAYETTLAGQRRRALAAYAEAARRDWPWIAEAVEAALRARRAARGVVPLRAVR